MKKARCLCEGTDFETAYTYEAPPAGEVRFGFSTGDYRRTILRCLSCGHFLSTHDMNMEAMYSGEYVNATYGDNGLRRAFDKINALDPAASDNVGRVRRLLDYSAQWWKSDRASAPSILDVGSGLCVFLHRMKQAGWICTALDPDPRAAAHAKTAAGVDHAILGDFMTLENVGQYDVVTFNKVLEHVQNPAPMLGKALSALKPGGFVYIELPDGEGATREGFHREEFFIDHWHIFTAASLALLAQRAGFVVSTLERLQEPSSKYTLRAFLAPATTTASTTLTGGFVPCSQQIRP